MAAPNSNYRQLDPQEVVETVRVLHRRIEGRFPASGLGRVAGELLRVAQENVERTQWIQKPQIALRIAAGFLSLIIIALLVGMLLHIRRFQFDDYANFIQSLESSISAVVFIGAAILFFVSWENRIKRSRALNAVHELRALAHIIDMHQLTKDPAVLSASFRPTENSPQRILDAADLSRYLDYCSEMLSITGKLAALYAQSVNDDVVVRAVNDVETLGSNLSRKIWQKLIMIADSGEQRRKG